jgi:hypothetical protein
METEVQDSPACLVTWRGASIIKKIAEVPSGYGTTAQKIFGRR